MHRFGKTGHYTYLRSSDLISVVRAACKQAYPDPNHFIRLNISCIVAHSNRVAAAVALYHAGWTIEKIADRIRWAPESVKHYIRETEYSVGDMTATAINNNSMIYQN